MVTLGVGEIFKVDTLISISVPHILEKIFFSLDYVSYTKCSTVSTIWNKLLYSERYQQMKKDVFLKDIKKELCNALIQYDPQKIRNLVTSGMIDGNYAHEDEPSVPVSLRGRMLLSIVADRGDTGLVKLIIEKGADINVQDKYGHTALFDAAEEGHLDVVKMLLDAGAKIDLCGNSGTRPMHRAAMCSHFEVVQLLLDRGADVNLATVDGYNPLHGATISGHKEIIKLLLKSGADQSMSINGITPLMIAQYCGHEDVIDILKQYGAV